MASNPARTPALAVFDLLAGLFEPVAAQIGLWAHAPVPRLEERVNVLVPELSSQELAAQKGWVPHDELHRGPFGRSRVLRVAHVQYGITVQERGHALQQWPIGESEAVVAAPLEVADPQ